MQCNLYNVYKYNYLCAFIADYWLVVIYVFRK